MTPDAAAQVAGLVAQLGAQLEAARDRLRAHHGPADTAIGTATDTTRAAPDSTRTAPDPGPAGPIDPAAAALALTRLLARCRAAQAETVAEPIRTVHTLDAPTGAAVGRHLAVAANVRLLAEIDPLAPPQGVPGPPPAPTDLAAQAHHGLRPLDDSRRADLFVAGLAELYRQSCAAGERLVLVHGLQGGVTWAGPPARPPARPSLRALVAQVAEPCAVLVVRDPVDAWRALWAEAPRSTPVSGPDRGPDMGGARGAAPGPSHAPVPRLAAYVTRLAAVLDAHADLPIHRLEDIEADPAPLFAALDLPWAPGLPAGIGPAPAHGQGPAPPPEIAPEIATEIATEIAACPALRALRARLGY